MDLVRPKIPTYSPARGSRITLAVVAGSACIVALSAAFALTPSSYSLVLAHIHAQDTGLLAGRPRSIRSDEWSVWTPYFQAAVRNRLERFNRTSFYGEDLRNINALPLRDWGIVLKPQMWAFFAIPAANAYGFYFGVLSAAFLAGYYFLFRELAFDPKYALLGSLLLFSCGFSQFWWTTFLPCLGFCPWVALIFLRRWPWFVRLPLLAYVLAAWAIACTYPILILSGGLGLAVLILALRSETLRSGARLVAAVGGTALALAVTYYYFADLIQVFAHSVYPGLRRSPPGTVPLVVLASQFWPMLTFAAQDFRGLTGLNLCEIATAGSFLPILTICVLDYSRLRRCIGDPTYRGTWWALAVIGAAGGLATWWMAGPCPRWIGRLLYWDRFTANRLLFLSGLLLLAASLVPWQRGIVAISPGRAALFVLLGPVAAAIVKMSKFGVPVDQMKVDWVCAAIAAAAALGTLWPSRWNTTRLMLGAVLAINAVVFLRFNPLQSAYPIFEIPDNPVLDILTARQSRTAGSYLAVEGFMGATLNGLGFRSVSHVLVAPRPEFFRRYFPNMERDAFDFVFNRYAHVRLAETSVPNSPEADVVVLPTEVFRPIRNQRRALIEFGGPPCRGKPTDRYGLSSSSTGADLVIVGWAPWLGESDSQTLRIRTGRKVAVLRLETLRRPDVAEALHNYNFEKSGFRLAISAQDHRPLSLNDFHLTAASTVDGQTSLDGCPDR